MRDGEQGMREEAARRELAEQVEDVLSRGAPPDPQLVVLIDALGRIAHAVGEAQARQGHWATLRSELREGVRSVDAACGLRPLEPRWEAFVTRQKRVAVTVLDAMERLQADESTRA